MARHRPDHELDVMRRGMSLLVSGWPTPDQLAAKESPSVSDTRGE
jgi:hypothetical protein